MKRAGLYARVSSDDQRNGWSIDDQLREMRAHCTAQGWMVGGEYRDEGYSAYRDLTGDRPAFQRLIADIEGGTIDLFVVKDIDRFSRRLVVTLQFIDRIERAGGQLVCLNTQFDRETPEGEMMTSTIGAFAQFYSSSLSRRISSSKRGRFERGLPNGDLPFGYVSTGDAHEPPAVVPAEAEIVTELFERYGSGMASGQQLARWLETKGVSPRSKVGKRTWSNDTVMAMLANPLYAGHVTYKGETRPGAHEPIVPQPLFDQVQRVRGRRSRSNRSYSETTKHPYLLRNLARCVRCDLNLRGHGSRYRYYLCPHRRVGGECGTKPAMRPARGIEAAVTRIVEQFRLAPQDYAQVMMIANESPDSGELERREEALRARRLRLRHLYEEGELIRHEYDARLAAIRGELKRIEDARRTPPVTIQSATLLREYGEAWSVATDAQKEAIVRTLFDEVHIDLGRNAVATVTPCDDFRPLVGEVLTPLWESEDGSHWRTRPDSGTAMLPRLVTLVESGLAFPVPSSIGAVA